MTNLAAQRLGLVAARSAVEALQLERLQAAAARTGLSDHQLRGLIRSGRLPAYHLGRWYLLDVRVLDALLKECVVIPRRFPAEVGRAHRHRRAPARQRPHENQDHEEADLTSKEAGPADRPPKCTTDRQGEGSARSG